jgi:hypothetical protein
MSKRAGAWGAIGSVGAALVLALAAPQAAFAIDIIESQEPGGVPETKDAGWQAGTCSAEPCSAETKPLLFTQAAGHPPFGYTQIIVKHGPPGEIPVGELKTVRVDLPPGLSVNPEATPQCALAPGQSPATCPASTQVGISTVTAAAVIAGPLPLGAPVTLPPVPVYNIVPRAGEPARFGFSAAGSDVFLEAGLAWDGDYHEFFTIHAHKIELPFGPLLPGEARLLKNRLSFFGNVGQAGSGGAFLTTPSTCFDPEQAPFAHIYSTFLRADSFQEEAPQFPAGAEGLEAPLPKGVKPTGCGSVPFAPSTAADPGTARTDSPAGVTVDVRVPFAPAAAIYQSNVREARVTLPRGLGINPSAAETLQACTDQQFGKGTRNPVACPAGSRIGTVAIDTPPLPDGTLTGNVYLGQQLSRDPTSGEEYRIFLHTEAPSRGLSVRLVANVVADPRTGQLTGVVRESPQVPFDLVRVKLDGGPRATLSSPPTCGPNPTSHAMTAWSGSPDGGPPDKGFTLSNAPGGGPCAKTMAARPFAPGFTAGPKLSVARKYTPFSTRIARGDGEQELKGVDLLLPAGASARLKGVPYCRPAALAAIADRSGLAERRNPACSEKSQVGVVSTVAGTGPSPLEVGGKAYLAGPHEGAPLSLAVVTPAVAGPFDLGNVLVRVPLFVNPETARIHPKTDAIPDVFGGTKLDVRAVAVDVNRKRLTLNGTSCRRRAAIGALLGGGADPTRPATFSSFAVSAPAKATKCKRLRFRPKLHLRLFGATQRAKQPRLRAVLKARSGDANIGRAAVALPHALFLDQSSLATICTRVQFAADECPKRSVYGHAKAISQLLGKPLEGPVYLRSSDNPLPDLVAHLEGQVEIDVVGKIDSFRGGIRTIFGRVPDVPVSKFTMVLPGGKNGLLVASRDLCARPVKALVRLRAQNGKKLNRAPTLRTPCNGKGAGKAKGRGQRGAQ